MILFFPNIKLKAVFSIMSSKLYIDSNNIPNASTSYNSNKVYVFDKITPPIQNTTNPYTKYTRLSNSDFFPKSEKPIKFTSSIEPTKILKQIQQQYKTKVEKAANECKITYKEAINYLLGDSNHQPIIYKMLTEEFGFKPNDYYKITIKAFEEGYPNIIKITGNHLNRFTSGEINNLMLKASKYGYIDIVNLMLKTGAGHYNWAMAIAAKGGHIDIVEFFMLNIGATNYNWAMAMAAKGGHIDIVRFMLKTGADNYNWAMINAAKGGYTDIVELMLDLGANDYNIAMAMAAKGGHMDIVELMLKYEATTYDKSIAFAAKGGHIDIV